MSDPTAGAAAGAPPDGPSQLHLDPLPADDVLHLVHLGDPPERRSVVRLDEATAWADGRQGGGLLFGLADAGVGRSCVSALRAGELVVTTSLHIGVRRQDWSPGDELGVVSAPATRTPGGLVAAATFTLGDEEVGTAFGRFAVIGGASGDGVVAARADLGPSPAIERPPAGHLADLLQLGEAVVDGERLELGFVASTGFANERMGVHGRVGALVGHSATEVLLARLEPDADVTTVEMHAQFLRPIPADGGPCRCVVEVRHRTRSVVATSATLLTDDGRPALVVDSGFAVAR